MREHQLVTFKHHKPGRNFSLCNVSVPFRFVKFESPDAKFESVFPEGRKGNSYGFITIIKLRTNKPPSSLKETTRPPPWLLTRKEPLAAGSVYPRVEGGTRHARLARLGAEAKPLLLLAARSLRPREDRGGRQSRMHSQSSELEHTIPRRAGIVVGASAPSRRVHQWLKNVLDVAIAIVALVVFWPVLLTVALVVKLDSPGPAIFKQNRIGKDGKMFTVRKFRSMYVNADDALHREALKKLVQGEPVAEANGQAFFKPADDPRVTRVGKFLRATGLDELPQVINILQRDMSVVGPRPAIPYELELYKDWHHRRLTVRPGVTGLWQVKRHDTGNFDDVMKLDLEYIDSFSIWLDLKIIVLTVPMILFRRWTF